MKGISLSKIHLEATYQKRKNKKHLEATIHALASP